MNVMAGYKYPLRRDFMDLSKLTFTIKLKEFIATVDRHNVLSYSAALSYYASLALAPFLLILLTVGSLIGQDAQEELIFQAEFILGEDIGTIIELVFSNMKQEINLASFSGIIGIAVLLFTASIVFLQLRFTLDTIKGDYDPKASSGVIGMVKQRLLIMLIVLGTAVLFFLSMFISDIVMMFSEDLLNKLWGKVLLSVLSFIISVGLFTAIYYFIPSKKPVLSDAFKMSIFTSVCFLVGRKVLGMYLENVAADSVYGAAGSLLVFLVWAYYSSFTLFISMELYLFFGPGRNTKKISTGAPKS